MALIYAAAAPTARRADAGTTGHGDAALQGRLLFAALQGRLLLHVCNQRARHAFFGAAKESMEIPTSDR